VRLALLAEAEAELEAAATWYDDRSKGLGDEFLGVAREALTLIVESPETWPPWPKAPTLAPLAMACSLRNGLPIVTGNVAHDEQVRSGGYDLYVENWRTG
jgi:hypothetical protein